MKRRNFTKILCSLPFVPISSWNSPSKEIDSVKFTSDFKLEQVFTSGFPLEPYTIEEPTCQIEILYKDQSKRTFISKSWEWHLCSNKEIGLEFIGDNILFNHSNCYAVFKNIKEIL
jgi:hypothetical protein